MLSSSRKMVPDHSRVTFIHGTEKSVPLEQYDCIITNFFLDVFSENHLFEVMSFLRNRLSSDGVWLCSDFRSTGRLGHKFLLWLMHGFFRMFTALESRNLLDFRPHFSKVDMRMKEEVEFRNGLIFSAVYEPI